MPMEDVVVGGLVRKKNMPTAPREINMNTMDRGVSTRDKIEKGRESGNNKALLIAFYRVHNPRKVNSVDKVLKLFEGRDEVLNDRLKRKYGRGFLPDEAPKGETRYVRTGGENAFPVNDGVTTINGSDNDSDLDTAADSSSSSSLSSSTFPSLSLARGLSMGSKLGSKLKNKAIFGKINHPPSHGRDVVKVTENETGANEQDTSIDSGYERFLSLMNESTTETNNDQGGDTATCGKDDGKDDNEERSCQTHHQVQLVEDENMLPASQLSPPSCSLPQPPDSELSVEEEDIPPNNAGNLDGKYYCESCNVECDEATSDGKDNDEEGSRQTHRRVESVGDENMLLAPQLSLPSCSLLQPSDSELSVEKEDITSNDGGSLDEKCSCESCNVESDEATTDRNNDDLGDTPTCGGGDGKVDDGDGSCHGDENMLPDPQLSPSPCSLLQPPYSELASEEECTPPNDDRQRDGNDDEESPDVESDEAVIDTNNDDLEVRPTCRGGDKNMDTNEEEVCQEEETMLPAPQLSPSSCLVPQPPDSEPGPKEECTPPNADGHHDGMNKEKPHNAEINETASDENIDRAGDMATCGVGDDMDTNEVESCRGNENMLPAPQLFSLSCLAPQPSDSELCEEKDTSSSAVGENDGMDDQEPRNKESDEATTDTNNDILDYGATDGVDAGEVETCRELQRLEFLSDELVAPLSLSCTASRVIPQSLGDKLSAEEESTPETSISGIELMGRFSSAALGPSPLKLKGSHKWMNINMSMESSIDYHIEREYEVSENIGTKRDGGILSPNIAPVSGTQRPLWCSLAQIPVVSVSPPPTSYLDQRKHNRSSSVGRIDHVTQTADESLSSTPLNPDICAKVSPWPSTSLCEAPLQPESCNESGTRHITSTPIHSETSNEKSLPSHRPPPSTSPHKAEPLPTHPTSLPAMDCITQYSSLKSPSPAKMNHFAFDESMDTSIGMNDSVLDDITNVEYNVDADPCEGDAIEKNKNECAVNPTNSEPILGNDARSQDKDQSRSRRSPRQSDGDVCTKQMKFKHPSSIKLSRTRSQRSNITDSTTFFQQEYKVDYSCSTPLERLARDVGNTLRQWRVHQGCDWHVSLDWAEKMKHLDGEEELHELESDLDDGALVDCKEDDSTRKAADPPIQCMSMDICERGFANRARTIHSWMGDASAVLPSKSNDTLLKKPQPQSPPSSPKPKRRASFAPPKNSRSTPTGKKATRESYHRGARCIRSQKILFHTTGYSPEQINGSVNWSRRQYSIPLLLKLWDAPYSPVNARGEIFVRHGAASVPRSLQPGISSSTFSLTGELGILSPCGTDRQNHNSFSTIRSAKNKDDFTAFCSFGSQVDMATGLTRDISSLFDIGQHITLCLDHSEISIEKGHADIESYYNDLYFCIENNINEAIESQRLEMHERRRREKQRDRQLLKRNRTRMEDKQRQKTQQDQHETDDSVTIYDDSSERDRVSEFDSSESEDSYHEYTLDYNDLHLEQHEIHAEVAASLTALLQTALNLAASDNDCSIPVFGIWGDYCGDSLEATTNGRINSKAASSWIFSRLERNLLQIRESAIVGQGKDDAESLTKLLFSSPVLSGTCLSGMFQSTHRLYYIPTKVLPLHLSTLNGLAKVLLTQCPSSDDTVVLSAARHRYHWEQRDDSEEYARKSMSNQEWRIANSAETGDDSSPIEMYRERCQQHALLILRRASSPLVYGSEPMWGPSEGNPLVSLSASVTWGVIAVQEDSPIIPPTLLKLPLRIRSSNFASTPSELLDMEYALQSAALNPIGMGVVEREGGRHEFGPQEPIFLANAEFDIDAPCATLSANTRCVLAALLRCGSLGSDTLPGHLTKRNIIVQMSGESTGGGTNTEGVLHKSLTLAKVGPVTKRLIDALDWGDIKMDISEADFDRATNEALQRIQSTAYPAPPAEVFSIGNSKSHSKNHKLQSQSKGSPPGRLLSILFAHMARLRTPPSMMRLWLLFVEELRTRWDNNESLPNLGFVPGLDSTGDADTPHSGLQKVDSRVLGHRASHAAFVNSSEPDPDRDHCIINQMLQVYNICIECKMSMESLHDKRNSAHDGEINDSMESGGTLSGNHSSEDDDEFFDPDDEVIFSDKSPDMKEKNSDIERMLLQVTVTAPSHNRIGARCPVPYALPLGSSGDQLYAPYLQRTMPMTDEEEQKQKKFMGFVENAERRPSIKSRIDIAQRLQKPKLLSDMSSFKAANNGAVFEDFVRWYGNPVNPLNEEVNGETARRSIDRRSKMPPDEAKTLALEEASEAIAILMSLRAFWEDTWEEAEPCPAFDQEPLFNPNSTVEMVLHSFETMHPALLLNQVLSVAFTNVKFVLVDKAAGPAEEIRSVAIALANLRAAIDAALEMLTKDAADGFLHLAPERLEDDSGPLVYVSTSTATKCEEACDLIGEVEMLLSRALPLLRVLPGEYDLVDSLLQCKDGEYRLLKDPGQRSALLHAIKRHQTRTPNSSTPEAIPATREYVLRNLNPSMPCHLSARLVPDLKVAQSASSFHGSLLMGITKSSTRA